MALITLDTPLKFLDRGGRCECGCGAAAPIAKRTSAKANAKAGQTLRFLPGHNRRGSTDLSRWAEEDRGFETPCWIWLGPLTRKGYGRAHVNREHTGAHRAVYESINGPIAPDVQLDHLCNVRHCVNPAHLNPSSNAENSRRRRCVKMTPDAVRIVRGSQASDVHLADRFGVARQTINDIRHHRKWKHINGEIA